ncbi:hypothetical protein [Haloarchaeobius sp. HRN-SO-5]|uniref:hypothetical protein n=1 Tax=Haloarchaeobius sp. HRN-SO-5 TaxID=3446118 RepID=UPI003EBB1948
MGSREPRSGRTSSVWAATVAVCMVLTVYHLLIRPWHRTWGASEDEVSRQLPGDEMVPEPGDETTRAVTVEAPSEAVWSWVVQLGQGRGGFYSYTWLENAVGADIHNVDRIVPELQDLEEGDSIRMVREDYWLQSPLTSMTVEYVDRGRTLVLQGHDGGTWTFHLEPMDEATTRFIVRGRKPETRTAIGYVARYLAYELPHFVMERGMMLGIKDRAERERRLQNGP